MSLAKIMFLLSFEICSRPPHLSLPLSLLSWAQPTGLMVSLSCESCCVMMKQLDHCSSFSLMVVGFAAPSSSPDITLS